MGLQQGRRLATLFAQQPNVEVRYVCDVDSTRAKSCAEHLANGVRKKPNAITDFRFILDDKQIDTLVCAAPNHWHAPDTIFACSANKHVYVEKPCCHNPRESELMVQAARKYNRAVQVGTQRRSAEGTRRAIARLHEGVIGRVYLVRCCFNSARGSIGRGKLVDIPSHLNYDLWQGPAPRRPYLDNVVHYNWHWRWHWGNGELGNNGVHFLDLARWGLNVDYPLAGLTNSIPPNNGLARGIGCTSYAIACVPQRRIARTKSKCLFMSTCPKAENRRLGHE